MPFHWNFHPSEQSCIRMKRRKKELSGAPGPGGTWDGLCWEYPPSHGSDRWGRAKHRDERKKSEMRKTGEKLKFKKSHGVPESQGRRVSGWDALCACPPCFCLGWPRFRASGKLESHGAAGPTSALGNAPCTGMDRDVLPAASASLPTPHTLPHTPYPPQRNRTAATATGLGKTVGQHRGAEEWISVVKFWQFAEQLALFSGHGLVG